MTDLFAHPDKRATSPRATAKEPNRNPPVRVLAVVDGTECAGRVTKYLLDLKSRNAAIEVVLLNVQPKPEVGRLRGYGSFRRTDVEDRLINDLGRRVVMSAARHLDAASIAHKDRIELGDLVDAIVRCADEEKCDLIALAESKPDTMRQWLMRTTGFVFHSAASVVVHLANAPVLVVR
jgi:nucleotide-binding universal stress UspA family protein